jgi:Ca2+-binding EF-hand superfamily protein
MNAQHERQQIASWNFADNEKTLREKRLNDRIQQRNSTTFKETTATPITPSFCLCFRRSTKKKKAQPRSSTSPATTTTNTSTTPTQSDQKSWKSEREFHSNRPSSLRYLYDAFDSNGNGHYTILELFHVSNAVQQFLENEALLMSPSSSTTTTNLKKQNIMTMEFATQVLKDLDADQNGYLEYSEFHQWLIGTITKKQTATATFAQCEIDLCNNVLALNTYMMKKSLKTMYAQFDIDSSATMESDELLQWMLHVHTLSESQSARPTEEIAQKTILFLDRDDSGTIEEEELFDWLREGQQVLLNIEKRSSFLTSTGTDGQTILDFLDMVVLQAAQQTKKNIDRLKTEYFIRNQGSIDNTFLHEHRQKRLEQRLQRRKSEKELDV